MRTTARDRNAMSPKTPVILLLVGLLAAAAAPADRRSAAIVSVVQAEHDFAVAVVDSGIRRAFLDYLAPDAIVFRPLPVPARGWFESRPAGPGVLSWRPAFVDGARAGDLGWSTGPWAFRASATDTVAATGEYVTVWKLQPDGSYRLVIDAGHDHPPSAANPERVAIPLNPGVARSGVDVASERKDLLKRDRELAKGGTVEAQAAALLENGTDDLRVLRAGEFPVGGIIPMQSVLAGRSGKLEVRPLGADVSSTGDVGYSYGLALHGAGPDTSTYLRLWRRARNGRWQVALDLDVPVARR